MNTAARTHNGDSSHWYYADGRPCYEMEKKDGSGMRPTTLADARKLNLLPSVTTILRVLHRHALVQWMIEQAVLAVETSPRKPGEPVDEFVERVLKIERQQDQEAKMARDLGKEIHAGMEAMLLGKPVSDELRPWIEPAYKYVKSRIDVVINTEYVLVGDGYAGRTDLIASTLLIPDGGYMLMCDWKSAKKLPGKGPWNEHRLQLAAYAAAASSIFPASIRTANLYISTVKQGEFVYYENPPWQRDYECGFAPLVQHWQWWQNYAPKQTPPGTRSPAAPLAAEAAAAPFDPLPAA